MADFSINTVWINRYNGKRVPKRNVGQPSAPGSLFGDPDNPNSDKHNSSINKAVLAFWEAQGRTIDALDQPEAADFRLSPWQLRKYTISNNLYGTHGGSSIGLRGSTPGAVSGWKNYPTYQMVAQEVKLLEHDTRHYNYNGTLSGTPGIWTTYKLRYQLDAITTYYSRLALFIYAYGDSQQAGDPYSNIEIGYFDLRAPTGSKYFTQVDASQSGNGIVTTTDPNNWVYFSLDLAKGFPSEPVGSTWGGSTVITVVFDCYNINFLDTAVDPLSLEQTYNYMTDVTRIVRDYSTTVCVANGSPWAEWSGSFRVIDSSIMKYQGIQNIDCKRNTLTGLQVRVWLGEVEIQSQLLITGYVQIDITDTDENNSQGSNLFIFNTTDSTTAWTLVLANARSIQGLTVNEDLTPSGVMGPVFIEGETYRISYQAIHGYSGPNPNILVDNETAGGV
jgi:hypothetical protein